MVCDRKPDGTVYAMEWLYIQFRVIEAGEDTTWTLLDWMYTDDSTIGTRSSYSSNGIHPFWFILPLR